jgi:predicted alpha/beta hydrolase family esterase
MHHTTLIVPGFHGSGPAHWQTWLEIQLPDARRVRGIDWESPVLARWAQIVRDEIDASPGPVWLVAHSFGCLASVVAASDRLNRVAGLLLVAPADPERFTPFGLRDEDAHPEEEGLSRWIPRDAIGAPSIVVASTNDPWVRLSSAAYWADSWGSHLVEIGAAGHINVDSGHGPWPRGLELLHALKASAEDLPLGSIDDISLVRRGRQGALARLRHGTRGRP